MVICLGRGADLHMAQLMPLPLTVSCFSKIQIGFTFLVLDHPGSLGQRAVRGVCVCACVCAITSMVVGSAVSLVCAGVELRACCRPVTQSEPGLNGPPAGRRYSALRAACRR